MFCSERDAQLANRAEGFNPGDALIPPLPQRNIEAGLVTGVARLRSVNGSAPDETVICGIVAKPTALLRLDAGDTKHRGFENQLSQDARSFLAQLRRRTAPRGMMLTEGEASPTLG